MADKFKPVGFFYLLCLFSIIFSVTFAIFSVTFPVASGDNGGRAEPDEKTTLFWRYRIVPFGRSYWAKLRAMVGRGHSYFFPPKIDGKDRAAESSGGTGEKLKEAAEKSFEKSKETVEEAAKSAAQATGEAANRMKEKVKKSLSCGEPPRADDDDDGAEL